MRWLRCVLAATLCWACSMGRCGQMYDNTCPCCRAGHK